MKVGKLFALVLGVAVLIAADSALARGAGRGGGRSGAHHGHHHSYRSSVFVAGAAFYPAWYYYPAGAYVQPAPPMQYIERGDDAPGQDDAWLYCPAASAYFPSVVECPGGWQRVPGP